MLKEIIKRDGTTEPFIPAKVNSWSIWASEQLGERVDWSGVVMEAMSHFKDKASSQDLQKQLIKICVQKRSWPYSLMAGRLYAALSCKEIYGSTKLPTIKEVHNNCFVAGLMKKLDYSDYEYAQIEKFIDHNRDFELAYPQLLQLRKKYAIRNRTNGQEFESAQFVYMRMAMALAEDEPKEERLHHVVNWYNHFSFNRLNAPSPNYINLGTKLNGYASCFPAGTLVSMKDNYQTIETIKVGDEVIAADGKLHKVYHVQNKPYKGKFVRLNTVATYTDELTPTEDHRFFAIKNVAATFIKENDLSVQREWVKADNLRVGDYIKMVYLKEEIDYNKTIWDLVGDELSKNKFILEGDLIVRSLKYDEGEQKQQPDIKNINIFNNDLFKLFGYFLGNGCICKPERGNKHLILTLPTARPDYLEEYKRILENLGCRVSISHNPRDNSTKLSCYSRPIVLLLEKLFSSGFDKKSLPYELMTCNRLLQLYMLAGLTQADGCAVETGYVIAIYNKKLITQFRDIALRLGFNFSISARHNFNTNFSDNVKECATIKIHISRDSTFSAMVNKDTYKVRDTSIRGLNILYLNDGAYARVRLLSSYEEETTVYDISVEDDPSFGASGLVAHNCCVLKSKDDVNSLAIGDHIAYKMTAMSAGIGGTIETRSINDPVRGGAIKHGGKLSYYRSLAYATKANQQAGRGGAATMYYSAFDPENTTIAMLQNPMSTEDAKIREIHFGVMFNRLFTKKAAKNEDVFLFTEYSAPDLWKLMFSGDQDGFEKLYKEYEDNEYFEKKYINARDFVILARQQAYECGTHYELFIDEMNRHTPFKDPIHSSNLCVAGDTQILTDKGYIEIRSVVDTEVNVWNGQEWSAVIVRKTGENKKLYRVWTRDYKYLDCTAEHRWYIDGQDGFVETKDLLSMSKTIYWTDPKTKEAVNSIIDSKQELDGLHDTYCFTEEKRHMGVFNGILAGQCAEIALPTEGYYDMQELYSNEDHGHGEIAICSLGAIVICNIKSEEQYRSVAYYGMKMIDKCIDMSDYPFPHVAMTAKARRSAGLGMMGVATELARKGLKYSTQEGKDFFHEISERHSYYSIEASLRLAKEKGNAPWIHKTKWPEGWLPIDTYKKSVDEIVKPIYRYDWENLRSRIIKQGGIRNSVVTSFMPTESSSKSAGVPNSIYPIRELALKKSDNANVIDWVATDSDLLKDKYELAWDIPTMDMIKVYAIVQKFTDQGISADFWKDRSTDPVVHTDEIIEEHIAMCKYGMKSRYYQNSLTSDQADIDGKKAMQQVISSLMHKPEITQEQTTFSDDFELAESERGCGSGGCTI